MMMKRLALVAVVLWLAVPGTSAAQKRYRAERFDVDLRLARDGSMRATEMVAFRFEGGSFTEVLRQIPRTRTDGIVNVSGTIDGQSWPPPGGEGRFRVDREHGVRAIWRFPATRDTSRVFGLAYTARGVVERQIESDVFTWYVLPTDHKYAIGESRVRLEWPDGARPIGAPLVTPEGAEVAPAENGVVVVARNLAPDAVFRVTIRFETGSLIDAMPEWQARGVRGREAAPTFLAVAGLVLAAGLSGLFVFWNGQRREPLPTEATLPLSAPPGALPPALAGSLMNPLGTATVFGFFGTLLDLARRGAIRIDESAGRVWPRSRAFDVERGDALSNLRPHERAVVDLLFAPKGGRRDRVGFSDVVRAARSKWRPFRSAVVAELVDDGFVSPERRRTRNRILAVGISLLVLAGLMCVPAGIMTDTYDGWPLILPAAVALLGLVVTIFGSGYSTLTDEGRREAAGWKAYARHLKQVARFNAPLPDAPAFEHALAFATAAGLGSGWVKAFRKSGKLVSAPAWFKAASAADAARQLDGFVAMMASVHSAGHSGGGTGAASAGGGGASGAR